MYATDNLKQLKQLKDVQKYLFYNYNLCCVLFWSSKGLSNLIISEILIYELQDMAQQHSLFYYVKRWPNGQWLSWREIGQSLLITGQFDTWIHIYSKLSFFKCLFPLSL